MLRRVHMRAKAPSDPSPVSGAGGSWSHVTRRNRGPTPRIEGPEVPGYKPLRLVRRVGYVSPNGVDGID